LAKTIATAISSFMDQCRFAGRFQHAKDQYVPITEEELESLEAEANRSIGLKEFIPLASVVRSISKTLTISARTKAVRSLTGCSLMPWPRAAVSRSPSW
jgi:hypothetical protein